MDFSVASRSIILRWGWTFRKIRSRNAKIDTDRVLGKNETTLFMKSFFFISLISVLATGCQHHSNQKEEITAQEFTTYEVEDQVEPPPPDLKSSFNTIQEWLSDICDSPQPERPISAYRIGIWESENKFTLSLAGYNKYSFEKGDSSRIEFLPSSMYFPLPENEYKNLTRGQVLLNIDSQLAEFCRSAKFRNSFLSKARSIVSDKGVIWSGQHQD